MTRPAFPIGLSLALTFAVLGAACQPVNDTTSVESIAEPASEASDVEPTTDATPQEPTAESAAEATSTVAEPVVSEPVEMPPLLLSDKELNDGWISLFDGRTLFGWKAASDANWQVEDGTIVVSSGTKGLLHTTTQFADYELRLDFRSEAGANSGIFLHTPPEPTDPKTDCYELNIADSDNPFPTGSLVYRQKAEGDFESTDWQSYDVTVQGGQVTVRLDGEQILAYTDPQPLNRGYIGLQYNSGRVAFRNICLKPLGTKPIFNGKDLSGWKEYPEMASRFSVTDDGELNVKDGRGQLETEDAFGDFALQLQCLTHADGLNSGVFFRCIPGDVMMGYECQIHNGTEEGDRTRPVDHGTGGIFRRQPARFVVADDQQWFHLTLIANGPHMAAWVNGLQVSDWTDDRAVDENPRRGLRLEPGTIMIQGHDPTTDISFRGLQAAEFAPRREL